MLPKFEGIESCRGGDVFHDVLDDGVALGGAGRPAVRVGRRVGHHRVGHDLPFPSPVVDKRNTVLVQTPVLSNRTPKLGLNRTKYSIQN